MAVKLCGCCSKGRPWKPSEKPRTLSCNESSTPCCCSCCQMSIVSTACIYIFSFVVEASALLLRWSSCCRWSFRYANPPFKTAASSLLHGLASSDDHARDIFFKSLRHSVEAAGKVASLVRDFRASREARVETQATTTVGTTAKLRLAVCRDLYIAIPFPTTTFGTLRCVLCCNGSQKKY